LIICTIIIFFAITLPQVSAPQWWGNVTVFETMDATMTAIRKTCKHSNGQYLPLSETFADPLSVNLVAPGETFGPKQWI
jgi:hypothetical protein